MNFDVISENDIFALQNLVDVLAPVETAVTELSKNEVNLITVEGVYKFLFEKLQPMQTNIAKKLIHAIVRTGNCSCLCARNKCEGGDCFQ